MSLPLERHTRFVCDDVDEVREAVARVYCPHRLYQSSSRQRLRARHHHVALGNLSFNFLTYGADVLIVPGAFETFYMIELPLAGGAHIECGEEDVTSAQYLATVISPTRFVRSRWNADCRRLMVQIDRAAFERYLADLLGHALDRPLEFASGLDTGSGLGASLAAYLRFMVAQLDSCDDLSRYPLLVAECERMVMATLLQAQPSNYADALRAVSRPAAPRYVRRALEYIDEHYMEDVTVADLVRASGTSARTLFAGFRRYQGTSPMAVLKARRLEAVRADLASAGEDESVTRIALRWGFTHLGHFARDYQRRFGERPRDTLRRSRSR